MTRTVLRLLIVFVLSLGSSSYLLAQGLTADRFLEGVSARPVGDQVEKDQYLAAYQALNIAPPAEVERVLPTLLQYARSGDEVHARLYAAGFLLAIAIRLDGADLLSSKSEEISSLIVDSDPSVQQGAAAITDFVIGKPVTNKQPYLSALQKALQMRRTPQDAGVNMVGPLLTFGRSDSDSVKSVMVFLQRNDLTVSTRIQLVHQLGVGPDLPKEVNQYLVGELDDRDPHVRAGAVASFADSTTSFHVLAKDRVESMANDPQEIQGIRELAKGAMAGKTNLSPNYDVPPPILDPKIGALPQEPKDQ
jgi:hypothetical protein